LCRSWRAALASIADLITQSRCSPSLCSRADHKHLKPRSVLNAETVEAYAHQYTYLECVAFIRSVKTGAPFAET